MEIAKQNHDCKGDEEVSAPSKSRNEKLMQIEQLVSDAVNKGNYQQVLEDIRRVIGTDTYSDRK